ncbi:FimV/HubP family polar landmark protein [Shewanella goraebulensis]|uniref:FimV/HubP family polar landmark protein n=1 Tax=Shewanella goraebulensis TaxID=3050637 RepID=UPI00254F0728|nr:FimV/HubP family polar landmark protein [Shewanella goraebulensis]
MSKGIINRAVLALSLFLFSFVAQAALSHISINSRQFDVGQHPKIKLNIVAGKNDLSRISLHLRQKNGSEEVVEELMVQSISGYMLFAIGVDDVRDPNAKLIVNEYKGNSWRQYAVLSVFDAPFIKVTDKTEVKIDSRHQLKKVAPIPNTGGKAQQTTAVEKTPNSSSVSASSASSTLSTQTLSTPIVNEGCTIERDRSDTLWRIASRYHKQWQTNVYGAMLAIYDANPKAFSKQKIHLIRQDVTLMCPSQSQLNQYVNKIDDKAKFEGLEQQHTGN